MRLTYLIISLTLISNLSLAQQIKRLEIGIGGGIDLFRVVENAASVDEYSREVYGDNYVDPQEKYPDGNILTLILPVQYNFSKTLSINSGFRFTSIGKTSYASESSLMDSDPNIISWYTKHQYLSIPLTAKATWFLGDIRPFAYLGLSNNFKLSKQYGIDSSNPTLGRSYRDDDLEEKSFNQGLLTGGGLDFSLKNDFILTVEGSLTRDEYINRSTPQFFVILGIRKGIGSIVN